MLSESQVARKLLDIGAVKLRPHKPFHWASGLRAPVYCDNRLILSHPALRNQIKDSFAAKSRLFQDINAVAGVATAGIAHGVLLADSLDLPFGYVRSSAKKHGTRNQIEGKLERGSTCLVVEDLISTGMSSLRAVEALRNAGLQVGGVMAIFTYGLPQSEEAFRNAECPVTTLFSFHHLVEVIQKSGEMKDADINSLLEWSRDPLSWSKQTSK